MTSDWITLEIISTIYCWKLFYVIKNIIFANSKLIITSNMRCNKALRKFIKMGINIFIMVIWGGISSYIQLEITLN